MFWHRSEVHEVHEVRRAMFGVVRKHAMVSVHLFGPLRVDVAGTSLGRRDLGGHKPKRLLELLLLERGRIIPKDHLADHLCGETLPESVAATLETFVSVLRRRRGARQIIATAPGATAWCLKLSQSTWTSLIAWPHAAAAGTLPSAMGICGQPWS
jgi:DNA-binding response OmpR family regulator